MSDVTAAEFYRALDELRERLVQHIDNRATYLAQALEDHKQEDRRIADLVLQIKTQREEEAKQAIKSSAWVALVVSSGLMSIWQIVANAWKK